MKEIKLEIGLDVTELIGVTHYEKPVPANMNGLVKGNFPSHLISKTDEERIQNAPGLIYELKGKTVYSSVKCDGTSATYIDFNNEFFACSRNLSMKLDSSNVYMTMLEKYDIMNKLKGKNIAIQGEICGEGIQGNKLKLQGNDLFIFNVYDVEHKRYLDFNNMITFCKEYGFKTVPIIDVFTFNHTLPQLLEMSKGVYDGTNNRREGIVIRTILEMYSNVLKGRMSFKVLNNDYLLKDEE